MRRRWFMELSQLLIQSEYLLRWVYYRRVLGEVDPDLEPVSGLLSRYYSSARQPFLLSRLRRG